MRVLVASNGFGSGEAHPNQLIEHLRLAGLGSHTYVRLLSKADAAVPTYEPQHAGTRFAQEWSFEEASRPTSFVSREAERLHHLVSAHFPQWFVEHEATPDFTASAVVDVARAWRADLIVLDGLNSGTLTNLDAYEITANASCSVRTSYADHPHDDRALRLLIGLDGSEDCGKVVDAISHREFSHNTKIYLLHVSEMSDVFASHSLSMERTMAFHRSGRSGWVRHMLSYFESQLDSHYRHIETHIRFGLPAAEILDFAKEYEIDAVFVGPHGLERTGGTTGDRSSGGADRSSVLHSECLGRVAGEVLLHSESTTVEIIRRPSRW